MDAELEKKVSAANELVSSNSKFVASTIVLGQPEEASAATKVVIVWLEQNGFTI